jgi:membrane associated rhomboid family serine protease
VLIPIGDDDRKLSGPAYVTGVLLLLNLGAFVLQLQNPELLFSYSVVPYQVTNNVDLVNDVSMAEAARTGELPQREGPSPIHLTLITSLFLHAGWMHLLGNMLYLWIFGDNVEHRFGHLAFVGFYLVSGVAGSAAQIVFSPESMVPMLGASGAISGVLGAYLVLFPKNRVHAIFFFYVVSIPAVLAIGLWILFQVARALEVATAVEAALGGVAYFAHIGGFAAGIVMALVLRMIITEERPSRLSRAMSRDE